MAVRQLFGAPTWALLSTTGMKCWSPPPGVARVTVYADNDDSFTGQLAAYELAHRLGKDGIKAEVVMPNIIGAAFADLLPDLQEH